MRCFLILILGWLLSLPCHLCRGGERFSWSLQKDDRSAEFTAARGIESSFTRNIESRGSSEAFASYTDENGIARTYRRGVLLVSRSGQGAQRLRVAPGEERYALLKLRDQHSFKFAELDVVLTRQFTPSDPLAAKQWHHAKLGSTNAWALSTGYDRHHVPLVKLAIVDTPFQMNHPDLEPNSVPGWNVLRSSVVPFETNGYYHSTIAAGMAGAVLHNATGVAGMVNCQIAPVDIGDQPTTSDMYNAIVWAADHGFRVVNLSWDGAFSEVLNEAGGYLKEKAGGMLFMAGVNGRRLLNYPALAHIYAVAMTDTNDIARSSFGNHIDFAAPGWDVFATTTNCSYEADSGTSYSAPVLAGIAAWIMSVYPQAGPDEIEEILKIGSVDLGSAGWDQSYGWGRIDFAHVARETFSRLPISKIAASDAGMINVPYDPAAKYNLYRRESLAGDDWTLVTEAVREVINGKLVFKDCSPRATKAFYRIEVTLPQ